MSTEEKVEPTKVENETKKKNKIDPEKEREIVLLKVASGKLDTLQEKVAWLLNNYPNTRDSDIALQLQYWEQFESEIYNGVSIDPKDLYKLTRLTSIKRARATIQNTYRLFQASGPVRKHRGTLEEEEKDKAISQKFNYPIFAVFADESGKNDNHLIVGSMWLLHGYEAVKLKDAVEEWKKDNSFDAEFHFKKISPSTLPAYKKLVDLLKDKSNVLGFKAISVEKKGIKNTQQAFATLYYHLLVNGIEHEHETRRAPLPRSLQLWKDAEEVGFDKLLLAELEDKLLQASKSRFNDQLEVDQLEVVNSKSLILIQLADLFTGCVNRVLNGTGNENNHKDDFAKYFLNAFGMKNGLDQKQTYGDMTVHLSL